MSRKRTKNMSGQRMLEPGHPVAHGWRPVIIGVGLGIVALVCAALWRESRNDQTPTASVGDMSTPAATALPSVAQGAGVPINDVDPVTGKPIEPGSPAISYKGHLIGFCCDQSEGYKGAWARMSEAEKDLFVLRYRR